MSAKSIGELNYGVFQESQGKANIWDNLPPSQQIAWNEAATVVRYAHLLVERVIEVRLNAEGGRIIEETVNGGMRVEGGGTG